MTLTLCYGSTYELPMFDPVVATHVNASHSLVQTLIDQIEKEKLYARFFEGKQNLTFLDIGANIGLVSIYASPACSRIVAVEPAYETYQVLKALTLPFKNIFTNEFALSPKNDVTDFYVNNLNSTASSTVNTYGRKTSVVGWTLGMILRINQLEHIDVCKVDAEGGEGESLSFEELSNAAPIIDSWYIETHNCPKTTWQHKMEVLAGRFARLRYTKINVNGMALIVSR